MDTDGRRGATVSHSIPWQRVVYTRKGASDLFVFSHVEFTTQEKLFARSLSVRDLVATQNRMNSDNLEALQDATVMVLVTGKWAQHMSLNSCALTAGGKYPAPIYSLYDHLDRLRAMRESCKHCSELTLDYKALQYHSTLCLYTPGEDHAWRLFSVVPMLSDTVILPRLLHPSNIKNVLVSFSRATRKCVRDSLLVVGTTKYKENTLSIVKRRAAFPSSETPRESKTVNEHPPVPGDAVSHH